MKDLVVGRLLVKQFPFTLTASSMSVTTRAISFPYSYSAKSSFAFSMSEIIDGLIDVPHLLSINILTMSRFLFLESECS